VEAVEHVEQWQQSKDFEVWPENWPVVLLFLDLATQWTIVATMSGAMTTGLRYDGVLAYFRLRGERPRYMDDLQAMESAAVPVLNGREDG